MSSICALPERADRHAEAALFRNHTQGCVRYWTSSTPRVDLICADRTFGQGSLPINAFACASGYQSINPDIEGEIDLTSARGRNYSFSGDNPTVGEPMTKIWVLDPLQVCLDVKAMKVGDQRAWDDGQFALVFTRLADDNYKEFTLDINESTNPTPDGSLRPCE